MLSFIRPSFLYISLLLVFGACSKSMNQVDYAKTMLSGKTWYLDYTISNNQTKSFIGKSTYFIQFSEYGKTNDSDGIVGVFTVESTNNQLILSINASTPSGSPANYSYSIEQVGYDKLIVNYSQENTIIKKIFSTNH